MNFTQVARAPVYKQIADQLREAILSGALQPGDSLPAERALADSFGAGRASVREAIRALQSEGLVVAAGTAPLRPVVATDLSGPLKGALRNFMRLRRVGLRDLVELRCAIETAAVRGAARRADPDVLAEAEDAVRTMREVDGDVGAFDEVDVRFHIALSRASGNEAFYPVMVGIRDAMAHYLLVALRALPDPAAVIARLTAEHADILAAIRAGEGDEAAGLIEAHIVRFYEGLEDGAPRAMPPR